MKTLMIMTVLFLMTALTATAAYAALTDELVSYWDFDDGSGSTAADSVGTNAGTLHDMESGDWVTGKVGDYALYFDGVGEHVTCGNDSSIAFDASEDWTYAAWVKIESVSSEGFWPQILSQSNYDGNGWDFFLHEELPRIGFYSFSSDETIIESDLQLDQWNYLVLTYSDGDAELYVNGLSVDSGNTTFEDSEADFTIAGSDSYFNGTIDEVAIWGRVLSSGEIGTLYNSGAGYNPVGEGGGGVPEPATVVVLIIAGMGMIARRRLLRRRG